MLWICNVCTTAYSVGAPACPHCGGDDHVDEDVVVEVPTESEPESAAEVVKAKSSKGS